MACESVQNARSDTVVFQKEDAKFLSKPLPLWIDVILCCGTIAFVSVGAVGVASMMFDELVIDAMRRQKVPEGSLRLALMGFAILLLVALVFMLWHVCQWLYWYQLNKRWRSITIGPDLIILNAGRRKIAIDPEDVRVVALFEQDERKAARTIKREKFVNEFSAEEQAVYFVKGSRRQYNLLLQPEKAKSLFEIAVKVCDYAVGWDDNNNIAHAGNSVTSKSIQTFRLFISRKAYLALVGCCFMIVAGALHIWLAYVSLKLKFAVGGAVISVIGVIGSFIAVKRLCKARQCAKTLLRHLDDGVD